MNQLISSKKVQWSIKVKEVFNELKFLKNDRTDKSNI